MAKLALLNDQALGEGNPVSGDGLGFDVYAQVIADTASGTPGPFTIGVFGEWGTGKTSMLRMVKKRLDDQPGNDVVTVWFNAWRYEQEENPIVPLVGTIVRELEKNKSFLRKVANKGEVLTRTLRAAAYGFSSRTKNMIDRDEALTPEQLLDRSLYNGVFEDLQAVKLGNAQRVVVIVDDLDRCFPDQAVKLLESIKLVLGQQGFIFILGVARKIIEGYLEHRYQKDFGIADFNGERYLDKIVQLPFSIPDNINRMADLSEKLLARLEGPAKESLKDIAPIITNASGGNPRTVIRFINNVLIDNNINEILADQGMIRIPLEYFAVTRILQQRWEKCFTILIRNQKLRKLYITHESKADPISSSSEDSDYATLEQNIDLCPELLELLNTEPGQNWLSDNGMRVATIQFLNEQRKDETSSQSTEDQIPLAIYYSQEQRIKTANLRRALKKRGHKRFYNRSFRSWRSVNQQEKFIDFVLKGDSVFILCIDHLISKHDVRSFELWINCLAWNEQYDRIIVVIIPGARLDAVADIFMKFQIVDMSKRATSAGYEKLSVLINNLRADRTID